MPTHITGSYTDIYQWENLYTAWRNAAKGKRSQRAAAGFEFRLEDNLIALQEDLADESYHPGRYINFHIHEPKRRLISAAPFRDRVVHHALCQIIAPAFDSSFIHHSYANRLGKGTHRAINVCQQWLKEYRYVLPCDLRQFFPALDHTILQRTLNRRIQDGAIRRLNAKILKSGIGILDEAYTMVYFEGDELSALHRPRGLPIGNLTSQFWANCYLNEFDHFITHQLGCGAYLRYVDDFLLFANDKKTLWQWRAAIIERLASLRLTLHEAQAQVKPASEGVRFLGFVLYPNRRLLLRRKGIYYQRTLQTLLRSYRSKKTQGQLVDASIRGWINHVRYGNTWGLRRSLLRSVRL